MRPEAGLLFRRSTGAANRGNSVEILAPPFPLPIPLELRRSARARRLSLRVDHARQRVVLVAPAAVAQRHVIDFLTRHEGWLIAHIDRLPAVRPFQGGATVPILGVPHLIRSDPERLRGLVSCADGTITVPGAPQHLSRRLTDFLKKEAKRTIEERVGRKTAQLGRTARAVTVRDTRSRWGSCSAAGRLAFCWRLVLAPDWVLDYVVAHEVAHLKEMNHGPRFWALCAGLTDADPKAARGWLKRHGATLHAYG